MPIVLSVTTLLTTDTEFVFDGITTPALRPF